MTFSTKSQAEDSVSRFPPLNIDNATAALMERGWLDPESVVSGDLSISNAASRNRNLRVRRRDGVGYLIKQPDDPFLAGRESLEVESKYYSTCFSVDKAKPILPYI